MEEPYRFLESKRVTEIQNNMDDETEMRIIWCLPNYSEHFHSIGMKYFQRLFEYQGPKSVISYLKKEDYASSLEVRKKTILNNTKFEVIIGLTENGYRNQNKVFEAVYQFAQILRKEGP